MRRTTFLIIFLFLCSLFLVGNFVNAGTQNKSVSPTTLKTGLVSHWTFDGADCGAAYCVDRSGNNNTGAKNGGLVMAKGKIGQAGKFDGSNDSLAGTKTVSQLIGASTGTISVWVKPMGVSPQAVAPYARQQIVAGTYLGIYRGRNAGGSDGIWIYNSDLTDDVVQVTYNIGEWVHIVWQHANGQIYAYKNGVFVGSTASGNTNNLTYAVRVGGGDTDALYFNGPIDDVRIYNRVLSAQEIQTLYKQGGGKINTSNINSNVDTFRNGLVGHWTFDGPHINATQVLDVSGNNNTGTRNGGIVMTKGKIGQAGKFDELDDRVSIANSASLAIGTGSFTMSAWVYSKNNTGNHRIVYTYGEVGDTGAMLYIVDNDLRGTVWSQLPVSVLGIAIDTNKWHHVVLVRDAENMKFKLYMDGVLGGATANQNITSLGDMSTNANWMIGSDLVPTYFFNGSIDDVRVYNRALSAQEIKTLYQQGGGKISQTITPTTLKTGLVSHWTFDGPDCGATYCVDKSGNGNTGTRNGGVAMAKGKIGQAGKFDGSNDTVSGVKSINTLIGNSVGTMSVWVKPLGATTGNLDNVWARQEIISDTLGYFGIYRGKDGSGNDGIWVFNSATANDTVRITYNTGEWTHIVWQHVGGVLYGYKNGVLVDSIASGNTTAVTGLVGMGGVYSSALKFNGLIDDVRIYNRALSAQEIMTLYRMGK